MTNLNAVRNERGEYSTTHNMTGHVFYPVWRAMNSRCYNKSNNSYRNYGGRGISVCDKWKSSPIQFIEWLINNGYKENLQIDRIDNNREYSPSNCKLSTRSENCRNRRSSVYVDFEGVRTLLIELSEKTGIAYHTLYSRVFTQNMSTEDAVNKPFRKSRGK